MEIIMEIWSKNMIIEWILGILLAVSIGGNVALFVGGFKVEVKNENNTLVQTYQVTENNNMNILNNKLMVTLTNQDGKTNYSMILPSYPNHYTNISTNVISNYNFSTNFIFKYYFNGSNN
jgi:hypothetical protein